MTPFGERLAQAASGRPAVVGLDPRLERFPRPLRELADRDTGAALAGWSDMVLTAVAGTVPMVKPQSAFYEQHGSAGVAALEATCARARELGLLVLLDAKRGDIGSTAEAYARATLDDDGPMGADAVTLSPYLGPESLEPFLVRRAAGKGLFLLVRTSNPGAGALQRHGDPAVVDEVASWIRGWNADVRWGSVGAVVGATVPAEAAGLRARLPRTWLLVPGYGAQGGTAADVAALFEGGEGAVVTSSRAITYPTASEQDRYDEAPGSVVSAHAKAMIADLARVVG